MDRLVEEAKRAADRVHGDTSVSQKKTYDRLQEVKEHIEILMEAVETDLKAAGDEA